MAQIQAKKTKQAMLEKQQDQQANIQSQQQSAAQAQQGEQQNITTKAATTGQADAMVQLIKELGQENRMLMQEFLKNQTALGQSISGQQVAGQVQGNQAQIQAILNPNQGQLPVAGQQDQEAQEAPPVDPTQQPLQQEVAA